MNLRKSHLAAAVGAALFAGAGAVQAQAPGPVTSAQPATVQLYGQVSRALMFVDDGFSSKFFHVDAQPSSTRFGILAASEVMPGLRVGGRIETEFRSNPSHVVSMATPSGGTNGFTERWLDIFVEGSWGRVNMGQGSGAADDVSTIDLSGTGMPNGNCPTDWAGGIQFRNAATGAPLAGALAGADGTTGPVGTTGQFTLGGCNDMESRYDRFMYTTPTFGGFRVQVGQGQKAPFGGASTVSPEVTEASVWYSGKLAGELQAAIGYASANTSTPAGAPDKETIGFGVSWLHTSGFNVTLQGTQVEGISLSAADSRKAKYYNGKVGYKWGQHAIALDYGIYKDQALVDDDGKSFGLGYVWTPVRWAELYAGAHMFQLDRSGIDIEDIMAYQIGTRIRF